VTKLTLKITAAIVLALNLSGCFDGSSSSRPTRSAAIIDSTGGELASTDGVIEMVIPPNSVGEDTEFSIQQRSLADLPQEFPQGKYPEGSRYYELGPSGSTFETPITVSVALDQLAGNNGLVEGTYFLVTADNGEIKLLDNLLLTVDGTTGKRTLTGQIDHFSPLLMFRNWSEKDTSAAPNAGGVLTRQIGANFALQFSSFLDASDPENNDALEGISITIQTSGPLAALAGESFTSATYTPAQNDITGFYQATARPEFSCSAVGSGRIDVTMVEHFIRNTADSSFLAEPDADNANLFTLAQLLNGSNTAFPTSYTSQYSINVNCTDGATGATDTDADGIADDIDNCPAVANAAQTDSDNDGIGDACDDSDNDGVIDINDAFPADPAEWLDTDADGVGDNGDNCPDISNSEQTNLDGDAFGDACDDDRDGDGRANTNDAFPDDPNEWQDTDTDGIGDNGDNCPTVANPEQTDSNNDGIGDLCEPQNSADTDSDTVLDNADNCPSIPNTDQADIDGDGIGDVCDPQNDTDTDGDTVRDEIDNCPNDANTDQADIDGDGIGDVCDPQNDTDTDNDTIRDEIDNCPNDANTDQADLDGDGIGDVCDPQNDTDTDGDTVRDEIDNCPNDANTDQADIDGDGIGDVCDPQNDTDTDSDTIRDEIDNCPNDANTDQADIDGDGIGDVCDPQNDTDTDNDTVRDEIDNCPNDANTDQADIDGDGIGDVCDPQNDTDTDSDTIRDEIDNCPNDANTDQADIDGDGIGDVCDPQNDTDTDSDTVRDEIDNCPNDANTDQADIDGDGIGDVCDPQNDTDTDSDTVRDEIDNCPNDANTDQADIDGDGIGDVCDPQNDTDTDSDTIRDEIDNCPNDANTDQADFDNDGIGDVCDDSDGDGVVDSIDNCPSTSNSDQADADGNGIGDACDPLLGCENPGSYRAVIFDSGAPASNTADLDFPAQTNTVPLSEIDDFVAVKPADSSCNYDYLYGNLIYIYREGPYLEPDRSTQDASSQGCSYGQVIDEPVCLDPLAPGELAEGLHSIRNTGEAVEDEPLNLLRVLSEINDTDWINFISSPVAFGNSSDVVGPLLGSDAVFNFTPDQRLAHNMADEMPVATGLAAGSNFLLGISKDQPGPNSRSLVVTGSPNGLLIEEYDPQFPPAQPTITGPALPGANEVSPFGFGGGNFTGQALGVVTVGANDLTTQAFIDPQTPGDTVFANRFVSQSFTPQDFNGVSSGFASAAANSMNASPDLLVMFAGIPPSLPGELWQVDNGSPVFIQSLGLFPGKIRCLGQQLCAFTDTNDGVNYFLIPITWDGDNAPTVQPAVTVVSGANDLDIFLDETGEYQVLLVGDDQTFDIVSIEPLGLVTGQQNYPIPQDCISPGPGIWVRDFESVKVAIPCTGNTSPSGQAKSQYMIIDPLLGTAVPL
jgi:hypothetical protein